ncbi:hypothetical protein AVEN_71670-1 [Araneus ventricosus]|uniref:Uncharacterized protein n=1 Tax=Araneus ventricosus TaxID=182803 RepID=A0A4Y2T610_ARAVE|nr:hypothetical protein AVEN_241424-1 [Araneus ventricosus]GBN96058.1 hypothetical protein AVEN_71670-1 [Araneus ventricosus]
MIISAEVKCYGLGFEPEGSNFETRFQWRPRWCSVKASTPGAKGRRSENRFHRRSAVYGARCTLNHTYWPNDLPLVWRSSLEGGARSGVVLII